MSVRYVASKAATVAASAALFGGATAWIAAAARAPEPRPDAAPRRMYVVERTAPDGSTYLETVPPPRAVTRTRAS